MNPVLYNNDGNQVLCACGRLPEMVVMSKNACICFCNVCADIQSSKTLTLIQRDVDDKDIQNTKNMASLQCHWKFNIGEK